MTTALSQDAAVASSHSCSCSTITGGCHDCSNITGGHCHQSTNVRQPLSAGRTGGPFTSQVGHAVAIIFICNGHNCRTNVRQSPIVSSTGATLTSQICSTIIGGCLKHSTITGGCCDCSTNVSQSPAVPEAQGVHSPRKLVDIALILSCGMGSLVVGIVKMHRQILLVKKPVQRH